jgi:hypothetical protein
MVGRRVEAEQHQARRASRSRSGSDSDSDGCTAPERDEKGVVEVYLRPVMLLEC